MIIRIKNLRLRTLVGVHEWEQREPQEITVNVEFTFDGAAAARSDRLEDTVDYRALKNRLIETVEGSRYRLIERLASHVLELVMAEPRVRSATVEVDKPRALRFADSVSVSVSSEKES